MSAQGALKADQLTLGKLSIDWLVQAGIRITVLAGLVDTRTGKSRAWVDGTGIVWSERTTKAMEALRLSMEGDLAAEHLAGGTVAAGEGKGLQLPAPGLSEHLGTNDEVPSV